MGNAIWYSGRKWYGSGSGIEIEMVQSERNGTLENWRNDTE